MQPALTIDSLSLQAVIQGNKSLRRINGMIREKQAAQNFARFFSQYFFE
jgi:hypothetical protein